MSERVCPWWVGIFLASPIRRWFGEDPESLLAPYIREGMTILEPGPGMGFYTLPMAKMVGAAGRVIAVDLQSRMLDGLRRRAGRKELLPRIELRLAQADSLKIDDLRNTVNLVVAIAVVHEMPSADGFFRQAAQALQGGGKLLLMEPRGHVMLEQFSKEIDAAGRAGLALQERKTAGRAWFALFTKGA